MSQTSKNSGPLDHFFTRKTASSTSSARKKATLSNLVAGQSSGVSPSLSPIVPLVQQDVTAASTPHHPGTSTSSGSTSGDANSYPRATSNSRNYMDAVEIISPKAKKNSAKTLGPSHVLVHSRASSIHNVDSTKNKASAKRKKKFENDSDVECVPKPSARSKPLSSIAVTTLRPPHRSVSRKKARLNTTAPITVPSSQSDEEELADPIGEELSLVEVKESVNRWRRTTIPSPNYRLQSPDRGKSIAVMDIDTPSSPLSTFQSNSSLTSLHSEADTGFDSQPDNAFIHPATPMRLPTPPPSSTPLPLPVTPVALNAQSKTAKIIAEIKARAYANAVSSPEEPVTEFKDMLDDSSDEEDILWKPLLNRNGNFIVSESEAGQQADSAALFSRGGRYNLRQQREPSPLSTLTSSSISEQRRPTIAPSRLPIVLTKGASGSREKVKQKATKAFDPLQNLLKEKQLAEKRINGAIGYTGKILLQSEIEDEDKWITAKLAHRSTRLTPKTSSPRESESRSAANVLFDEEERKRLLGAERGDAILNILKTDEANKQAIWEHQKVLGVPLWATGSNEGSSHTTEEAKLRIDFSNVEENSIGRALKKAAEIDDYEHIALILDTGILVTLSSAQLSPIVSSLCEIALSTHETPISASAFTALLHLWDSYQSPLPGIPFDLVIQTVVRLGARIEVMSSIGCDVDPAVRNEDIDKGRQQLLVHRLLTMIKSSAQARWTSNATQAKILLVLLLIALDPSTSSDTQREVMTTVNIVCQTLAPQYDVAPQLESTVCNVLLRYAYTLTPINKAYLLSFLAGGSGRATRIARQVAYALIVQADAISENNYVDFPSLMRLVEPLSPTLKGGLFELHEQTDYEDIGYHTYILSIALSDLDGYVAQERQGPHRHYGSLDLTESPGKQKDKEKDTPLQAIRGCIEYIHARITDTRAAHLDRSSTKAAIKRLSMRIYYQRMAALKSGAATRNRAIISLYFPPQASPKKR